MSLNTQRLQRLKSELIQFMQNGQIKNAEKVYLRHKNDEIHDVETWNIFASINSERKKYSEILHCCKKIISLNPGNFNAMYNAGVALQHLSEYVLAITYYEGCIKISPGYSNAYANCALCYELSGQTNEAIAYYQKTLELNELLDARLRLGGLYLKLGDTVSALNHYTQALNKEPNNEHALFQIAKLYYEKMNYQLSEKYYLKLASINPNNTTVLNNLGRLYEESGDTTNAIKYFNLAIAKNNKIGLIYRNLGKVLLKTKNLNEAESIFNKSLKIEKHPEAYFNIGKILCEMNNIVKAKEYLEIALNSDIPDDIEKPEEFRLAVKYFLSSLSSPDSFDQDKKSFISNLFDGYADKFDDHLVNKLEYKTPELIKNILNETLPEITSTKTIVDLGCGTGLCASFLKPYSSKLIGIDLSGNMIEKAEQLKLYDHLIVGEICEEISKLDDEIDIAIAADVFVYIGGLMDVFSSCGHKMKKNSIFLFSTEITIDDTCEYKLYDSGRYKHSIDYINNVTCETGFELINHHSCILRKEHDKPVMGTITLIKKT